MAESKRTFQSAKMDKDVDDRILKPGTYRDALNVSVDFSEDGNVGAIENLKGNELISNQDIYGLSSATNPNVTVVGSYSHPEEKKIYYFVTGDKVDGVFEYDIEQNEINTILVDSVKVSVAESIELQFQDANVGAIVSQNGTITVFAKVGAETVQSITEDFSANETGSVITRKITASLRVPPPYANENEILIGTIDADQPTKTAPEVITKNIISKTDTTATFAGQITNNSVGVTAQGFYYGYNTGGTALTLSELKTGGAGITNFSTTSSSIKNNFAAKVTSLPSEKLISYAAFATNSVGTTDGSVLTFTTDAAPVINRISGTEYVITPAIGDVTSGNATDEIVHRNIGYGSFFKSSGDCYLNIAAPSSDGIRANAANAKTLYDAAYLPAFSSNPAGLSFAVANGGNSNTNTASIYVTGFAANTSYQITVPGFPPFSSETIRINKGTPSGTYYTSTLNLNLTGLHVANAAIPALYEYNRNTSSAPNATYILGPVLSGEKAKCIIPLNNTTATITSGGAGSFANSFDASNLSLTVSGKTEGTDFDYYVENTSHAVLGTVPGIIFEGTPSLLGTTPTVNITYTT